MGRRDGSTNRDPERNGYAVLEYRDKNQMVGTHIMEDGDQTSLKTNTQRERNMES